MPVSLTPAERSLRAQIGAHALHASHDSRKITAAARAAFLAKFEDEVDPDGKLPEAERRRRARHARSAYFKALALKSATVRRRAKECRCREAPPCRIVVAANRRALDLDGLDNPAAVRDLLEFMLVGGRSDDLFHVAQAYSDSFASGAAPGVRRSL